MNTVPQIISIRRLFKADVDTKSDTIKYIVLRRWLIENNNDAVEMDCAIGTISYGDEVYSFIHGYPGDNPDGIIWNDKEEFHVGEGLRNTSSDPVVDWYYQMLETNGTEDLFCNVLKSDDQEVENESENESGNESDSGSEDE